MNRKLGILSLFLSVLFAGCSSEDPAANEGGETNGKDLGYIAVNIVQPKSVTGRADSNGFENGNEDENEAKKGLFFLFDESGNNLYKGEPQEVDLNGSGTGTTPEVERIYNTVLVIDGSKTDPTSNVKKLVCVLNAPDEAKSVRTIDGLKKLINNYRTSSSGTFIMSNSVYTADGNIATLTYKTVNEGGTTKEVSMVKKSAAEAIADPIEIYVERVVAKVEAFTKTTGEGFNNEGAKPVIGGVTTPLGIKVTGIEVANIANHSYLFKNVTEASTATTGIWTETKVWDTTNRRSYWETVPEIGIGEFDLDFENDSYTNIATNGFDLKDLTVSNPFTEYIQPNTSGTKTCILVTAQLTKDNDVYNDLAYIRGGYTSIEAAKNVVATYLATIKNWYKKTADNEYTQLEASDLEWKNKYDFAGSTERSELSWLEDYEVVAQIKTEGEGALTEIYNVDGSVIDNGVAKANKHLRAANPSEDDLAKNYCARVFTDGMCYYYVDIDQSSVV